jgi:hypothetical protein
MFMAFAREDTLAMNGAHGKRRAALYYSTPRRVLTSWSVVWQHIGMKNIYKLHRFPPSIIQHAVWLYYRINLSIQDVEDLLAERNISVSYEAIRLWINKFGPEFTNRVRGELVVKLESGSGTFRGNVAAKHSC